jgi:hypothetical protein
MCTPSNIPCAETKAQLNELESRWTACPHTSGVKFLRRKFLFWKEEMWECANCPARFPFFWKEILVASREEGK